MISLVTGANGFVGSAVTQALLEAAHTVRVLVRPGSDRRNINKLDVEVYEGDLRNPSSLEAAVHGCDNLFHVAADYRLWIPDPENMYEINVTGTKNLLLAAAESGVEHIVYTSSVATLGYNPAGAPADEDTPSSLADMIGHYKRSKYMAEEAVQELIGQLNLPVVIVNPSTPIGPRDIKPTPTGRIVLDTMRGQMPAFVDTGLNIVHVDDVAHGHILAMQYGRIGERYILGGENMSLLAILQTIDELNGKPSYRIRLPHQVVLPAAWIMERIAGLTGIEPRATVDSVRMAKKLMFFSSDKAMRELGYQYRPAREALADAMTWFRLHGYC